MAWTAAGWRHDYFADHAGLSHACPGRLTGRDVRNSGLWPLGIKIMEDLRVLCLHGYHGSGAILRRQMAPLAAALPANVELVYVDAPSLAEGDFGWWHEGFRGWERTRDWAVDLLRGGPRIDGIFGFSQGAALTGLLAALRDARPAPLSFEFAIMAGGFTSTLPQHAGLLRHKLTVPSVHVTGRADTIVPRRDSLLLADRFADPLILEHPGGHVIPADPAVTGPIAGFVAGFARGRPAAPAPAESRHRQ
jgi:pimeloyl-ACP methyl ester carboxylesterase